MFRAWAVLGITSLAVIVGIASMGTERLSQWAGQGSECNNNGVCETSETAMCIDCSGNFAVCGNGTVEGSEECDDGNTVSSDGCSNQCKKEKACCVPVSGSCMWTSTPSICAGGSLHNTMAACQAVCAPNCGNGAVDSGEQCDGGACCSNDCQFLNSSQTCRASAGSCDAEEKCAGSSATCPNDSMASSSTVCRAAISMCDVQEKCSGFSVQCPNDAFSPASTVCRASAGACDIAENCPGNSSLCPADALKANTVVCSSLVAPQPVPPQWPTTSGKHEVKCSGTSATCAAPQNTSPAINAIPNQSVDAGTPLTINIQASDGDSDTLAFRTKAALPSGLSIQISGTNTAKISGSPVAMQPQKGLFAWFASLLAQVTGGGTDHDITIEATDGFGATVAEDFTLTVNGASQSSTSSALADCHIESAHAVIIDGCDTPAAQGLCTSSFYEDVTFDDAFDEAPDVLVTVHHLTDSNRAACALGGTDKVSCYPTNITTTKFRIVCSGSPITSTCGAGNGFRSPGTANWIALDGDDACAAQSNHGVTTTDCANPVVNPILCNATWTQQVTFSQPFNSTPHVLVAGEDITLSGADCANGATDRYVCLPTNIDKKGFKLSCNGSPYYPSNCGAAEEGYATKAKGGWLAKESTSNCFVQSEHGLETTECPSGEVNTTCPGGFRRTVTFPQEFDAPPHVIISLEIGSSGHTACAGGASDAYYCEAKSIDKKGFLAVCVGSPEGPECGAGLEGNGTSVIFGYLAIELDCKEEPPGSSSAGSNQSQGSSGSTASTGSNASGSTGSTGSNASGSSGSTGSTGSNSSGSTGSTGSTGSNASGSTGSTGSNASGSSGSTGSTGSNSSGSTGSTGSTGSNASGSTGSTGSNASGSTGSTGSNASGSSGSSNSAATTSTSAFSSQSNSSTASNAHLICQNESCVSVSGAGIHQCTTNVDCVNAMHLECTSTSICALVSGPGSNLCTSNSECNQFHSECVGQSCAGVPGPGLALCSTDNDCKGSSSSTQSQSSNSGGTSASSMSGSSAGGAHLACRDQQCVTVDDPGVDECIFDSQCFNVHAICQNNQCVAVQSAGDDECFVNEDCIVTECSDSNDNDGDGRVDYPSDPGCISFEDNSEVNDPDVLKNCGNFRVDFGEECDQGSGNSNTQPNRCRTNCRISRCGDRVVDGNEECDDGNNREHDSCSRACKRLTRVAGGALCGNGTLDRGEYCDDGNTVDSDGCTAICRLSAESSCRNDYECGEGRCINGICTPLVAGEACRSNNQCTSGGCINGVCTAPSRLSPSAIDFSQGVGQGLAAQLGYPFGVAPNGTSPYALQPMLGQNPASYFPNGVSRQSPKGDTGPVAVFVMASGAAAGLAWVRRRRRSS